MIKSNKRDEKKYTLYQEIRNAQKKGTFYTYIIHVVACSGQKSSEYSRELLEPKAFDTGRIAPCLFWLTDAPLVE